MKTIIIGLGVTGYALAKYHAENNIPCMVMDSRDNPPNLAQLKENFPNIPVITGGFPVDVLRTANEILLSPGIALDHPAFQQLPRNIPIISEIELFARHIHNLDLRPQLVAITGSNGKSTVTTLLGEMAKAAGMNVGIGGNLGTPALELLQAKARLYILELSSFQLETTYSLKPTAATILNICPDHMDRYPDLDTYLAAKARIYHHAQNVVVNREDARVSAVVPRNIPQVTFGLDVPNAESYGLLNDQLVKGKTALLPVSELKLIGRHNIANALAALALGDVIRLPQEAMLSALRTFKGLSHRCEWVQNKNNVLWINDSKGTNVGATTAALQGLGNEIPGKWILIAGGQPKNADFTPLKSLVSQYCRAVVLIGEAAEELQRLFAGLAKESGLEVVRANSMEEAVAMAAKLAKPGDGVLLSPACASFDMFQNFEHRGEVFKAAVLGTT